VLSIPERWVDPPPEEIMARNGTHAGAVSPSAKRTPASEALLTAIRRARECLLELQQADGHWVGELEGDTILESEYVLLLQFMESYAGAEGNASGAGSAARRAGAWIDPDRLHGLANRLRAKQLPGGGWAIYPGGPAEIGASVKAYFALKLAGVRPDEPDMVRAREVIHSQGGPARANTFTKIYLALFGQYPWRGTPAIPPEIALLPRWFPFNLYEISSWSRAIVVPLSLVRSFQPVCPIPEGAGIAELFVGDRSERALRLPRAPLRLCWRNFFLTIDDLLQRFETRPAGHLRQRARRAAEQWMIEHFEQSGGLGAIFPPMVYALMALRLLGYPDDDPQVARARAELERFEIFEGETLRLQPCFSPVWDTALAIQALAAPGEPDHPALHRAAAWLLEREVRHPGDWKVKRPRAKPGGWCFEYENEFYPDLDDTAAVITALHHAPGERPAATRAAMDRAIDWMLHMQGSDGGWASFDVDNNRLIFTHVPFADHNAMLDPSTADITARTLEMLSLAADAAAHDPARGRPVREAVEKAIQFLRREQESDGAWYGRWGVNYIYGTWLALQGLRAAGFSTGATEIRRGAEWLRSVQNPDGGWGETPASYDDPRLRGQGPSTASQTAWAILGLLAAGERESPAVARGIEYLLRTQGPDGSWPEDQFTGTGFPQVFYLKYHLYRLYFPLMALARYEGGSQ
jgi:squalene-hopene/tetraprenyl-beta-curcumene cyclase